MIYVCDNFFNDPYTIRNIALKSKYESDSEGRWPGMRSVIESQNIIDRIVSEVHLLTKNTSLKLRKNDCFFQYVTKDYGEGVFHQDDVDYTCKVFLGLHTPSYSGTEVCDEMINVFGPKSLWDKQIRLKKDFYKHPKSFLKSYKYGRISKRVNTYFNPIAKIPNKFNRILLFNAKLSHRAQKFYGTSIKNSRLTLVSSYLK